MDGLLHGDGSRLEGSQATSARAGGEYVVRSEVRMTGAVGSVTDLEVQMGDFCIEAELENTEQLLFQISVEKWSSLGQQNFPLCKKSR